MILKTCIIFNARFKKTLTKTCPIYGNLVVGINLRGHIEFTGLVEFPLILILITRFPGGFVNK